jgi:uncharacterized protein YndB with AHSA1/START domain
MATADTASMRRSALTAEIRIHDDGPMIVATVALPDCTPDRALAAFTEGAAVSRWWRGDLKAQPAEGGPYTIDFPAISAGLTGRVVSLGPGRLEFTWSWDNEAPDSTVLITAGPAAEPDSTLLTITHGPHAKDEAGRTAHQEHWDGWEYFLPRLVAELRAQDGGMPP